MIKPILLFLSFAISFSIPVTDTNSPKDYLNIGKQITFNDQSYSLAWSNNPSKNYYKQEYLKEGKSLSNYNEMVTVEAVKGDISVEKAVAIKVSELEKMKKNNPVVNYKVYEKDEEKMIDFVLSDGGNYFEWNLYRYKKQKKGPYLVLYAYTYSDTLKSNNELKPFFNNIVDQRGKLLVALGGLKLKKVNVKK